MAICITTDSTFKRLGLEIAGFHKWETYKEHTNIERFRAWFGTSPKICEKVWRAMQASTIEGCHIGTDANPVHLLLALRFLKAYPSEKELAGTFDLTDKLVRKWSAGFTRGIQLLLPEMVVAGWEQQVDAGLIFFLSVDGTHCPIEEPRPFSTKWSSFKLGGKPGLNYEIGLSIHSSKLLWVYGPTPPGKYNDLEVFRQSLKNTLPAGVRAIGDKGYIGEADYISTSNDLDPREIAEFKERVLARHESFNKRLKIYGCLTKRFRHGVENHKVAFEAICVLTMFEMEDSPLFDAYPAAPLEE